MRILLPPSEGKATGGSGTPLGRRADLGPLTEPRRQVIASLSRFADETSAASALLLPTSVVAEAMSANSRVLTARTLPAIERYRGTVYDGLAVDSLSDGARKLASKAVLVFSGLFGVSRGGDPVPTYRVPAKAALPGLGIASTFWKPHLSNHLPTLLDRHVVVDLRSSDYAAMWTPAAEVAARTLVVRVLSVKPDGTRGVVSYSSKLGKGKLARALLEREAAGSPVRTIDDVADAWLKAGGHAAVVVAAKRGLALDLLD